MKREKIIIANWKMQLSLAESIALAKKIKTKFAKFKAGAVAVCPNFVALCEVNKVLKGSNVKLGSQNVFWMEKGAYTGEVPPSVLKEVGCEYAIIGHSERRAILRESYEDINKKVRAVLNINGLTPVICIGESWEERKTDRRDFILTEQLQLALAGIDPMSKQKIIVAYEPIWAIGSGTAIEPSEADYAHKIIRLTLNQIFGLQKVANNFSIIYGGSISSKNVKSFVDLENIDGLLVGGASLDAEEFFKVATEITK